jgi:hypothetical protein
MAKKRVYATSFDIPIESNADMELALQAIPDFLVAEGIRADLALVSTTTGNVYFYQEQT